ncbi:MAG: VWA domain-containing protein [Acidobacteriota bacterium]
MSHVRWAVVSALAIAAFITPSPRLSAQDQPAQQARPPVFRGGVNYVSVDAFPRRDGKVLEGLTKDDFQIFEDGKPQKVETFEFVHIDPNPADADRRDPTDEKDAERQAADPHNRLFVVFLDLAHTTIAGSYAARRPVVDFLTRTIGATDLFGVMTAEMPVSRLVFGRRTEGIDGQLATYWTWGQSDRAVMDRTPYERRLEVCGLILRPDASGFGDVLVQLSREDALHSSLESLMGRLRDLRDERKNVLFISEGWVPRRPQEGLLGSSSGDVPTIGIGTPTGNRTGGNQRTPMSDDRAWCDKEVARLAGMDFEQRYRALLTSAGRANVAFYPIDVGGLKGSAMGRADVRGANDAVARDANGRGAMQTLRELAENTGGIAIVNTNDLGAGVKRVSDDLASYYLLGYNSTNSSHDGRYRRIDVKVSAPRVEVSARRGYYAADAEMAASMPALVVPTLVGDEMARLSRLRADADLYSYGVPTATGADIVVELSTSASTRTAWRAGADVQVALSGAGGAAATVTGRIPAGSRGAIVSVPIDRTRGGPWTMTVGVSGDGDRAQDQVTVPVAPAMIIGSPLAWRALPSPRSPLNPMADFQLRRAERLHVEWPLIQEPTTKVARLLDRKGQPLGGELPLVAAPADRKALALDLPMSSLPEGDFLVDLTATSASGQTERRVLAFRVVR